MMLIYLLTVKLSAPAADGDAVSADVIALSSVTDGDISLVVLNSTPDDD